MSLSRFIQRSLLLTGLAVLPSFAQSTAADPNQSGAGSGTGAGSTGYTQRQDRDGDHNYGWVGLLGLAGLSGLMRRNNQPDREIRSAGTGTNRT